MRARTEAVRKGLTSTVHRLLQRHGLTGRRRSENVADRRRFRFERAGQLWMSDVMHGPKVRVDGGRKKKTYLVEPDRRI